MFSPQDLQDLEARGIPVSEAGRQLAFFAQPPAPAKLERPCTVGDGILRLDEPAFARAKASGEEAAGQGRLSKFVPASGAATRMFEDLIKAADWSRVSAEYLKGKNPKSPVYQFLAHREKFAFFPELRDAAAAQGSALDALIASDDWRPLLRALLRTPGLAYAELPKALLAFHDYPDGARTALEEHLVEAAHTVRSSSGRCRLHLTVSPEHRGAFERLLLKRLLPLQSALDCAFEVSYSSQSPATDTLAGEADGTPFRNSEGRLLFRPGGHGALLGNLEACGADIALLKNVDNVCHESQAALGWDCTLALAGLLARLQDRLHRHAEAFDAGKGDVAAAKAFLSEVFYLKDPPSDPAALARLLNRPLRIAGMVPNTGEPGGGPFWVRGQDGALSAQIVESAQVDKDDPAQKAAFLAATHFNPVLLACGLRDFQGRPFDLTKFRDDSAVFLSKKSLDGRPLRALELPGLWNGGMAGWLTLFVEVPLEAFNPVKTATDLLRPAHQPVG